MALRVAQWRGRFEVEDTGAMLVVDEVDQRGRWEVCVLSCQSSGAALNLDSAMSKEFKSHEEPLFVKCVRHPQARCDAQKGDFQTPASNTAISIWLGRRLRTCISTISKFPSKVNSRRSRANLYGP